MPPLEQNNVVPQIRNSYTKLFVVIALIIISAGGTIYFFKSIKTDSVEVNKNNPIPNLVPVKNIPVAVDISCADFKDLLTLSDFDSVLGVGAVNSIREPSTLSQGKMDCTISFDTNKKISGSYSILFNGISMGDQVLSILGNECTKVKIGDKSLFGTVVKSIISLSSVGDREACIINDGINKSIYFAKNIGILKNDPLLSADQQINRFYPVSVSVAVKYTDSQVTELAKLLFSKLTAKLGK